MGSVLAALAVVLVSDALTVRDNLSAYRSAAMAIDAVSRDPDVAAQAELLESAVKRGAGVKDSGTMLPATAAYSTALARLLLAAPVLWYILLLKDYFGLGQF